jgi:hypothetical protein
MNAFEKYAAKKKLAYMLFAKIAETPPKTQVMNFKDREGSTITAQPTEAQRQANKSLQGMGLGKGGALDKMLAKPDSTGRTMNFARGSTITANPSGQPTGAQRQANKALQRLGLGKGGTLPDFASFAKSNPPAPPKVQAQTGTPAPSLSPFGKPSTSTPTPSMRTATSVGRPAAPPTRSITTR